MVLISTKGVFPITFFKESSLASRFVNFLQILFWGTIFSGATELVMKAFLPIMEFFPIMILSPTIRTPEQITTLSSIAS